VNNPDLVNNSIVKSMFNTLYPQDETHCICYFNSKNEAYPYPPNYEWISQSGRYVSLCIHKYVDGYHYNEMDGRFQHILFDMENYDLIDVKWHDLEGINEIDNLIYGRLAFLHNYSLDPFWGHSFEMTKNRINPNSILLTEEIGLYNSQMVLWDSNINLGEYFYFTRSLKDEVLEKQEMYPNEKDFQKICYQLVEVSDDYSKLDTGNFLKLLINYKSSIATLHTEGDLPF
jgi:hypothetical protein